MRYSFDAPDAPTAKLVQYFEMMGHRAIYADGWKAVTRHQPGVPFDDDNWELYHLARGPVRVQQPGRGDARQARRDGRTVVGGGRGRRGCCPLDDRTIELFATRYRDDSPIRPTATTPTSRPMSPLPDRWPRARGRGWDMAATIERAEEAGGVLYATGTENSGVSLFVQDDRLVFDYNCFGDHHVVEWTSRSRRDRRWSACGSGGPGRAARRRCSSTVKPCGAMAVPFVMTMISSVGPSIGYDHGSPVSERYRGHFPFEGRLARLDVTLVRQASGGRGRPGRSRAAGGHVPAVTGRSRPFTPVKRAEAPASTSMTEPVMWRADSEARKTTAAVISSGSSQGTGCTCNAAMAGATSSRVGVEIGAHQAVEGVVVDHRRSRRCPGRPR